MNTDGTFLIENVPGGTFSLYLDNVTFLLEQRVKQTTTDPDVEPNGHISIIEELGIIEVQSDTVRIYNKFII